jgi:Zn-dependent M28 family amino/carboxypeptidase
VREYVLAKMRELGLKPRAIEGEQRGVKLVNLYGELEGTQPAKPPILLVTHYDSTPNSPGAADDATGVATILETIRALEAHGPLRNRIGVLITDGEEYGLTGAEAFVRDQPDLWRDVRLVVNLEARGNHGPVLMFETGRDNFGLIRLFSQACPVPPHAQRHGLYRIHESRQTRLQF